MYSIQFKIVHTGCWGSSIGTEFPHHEFASIDCHWGENQVRHLLRVRGDSKEFSRIKEFLRKNKDVLSVEMVSESTRTMYLQIPTKAKTKFGQFSNVFFKHGLFPIAPTLFVGNEEIWTLGSSNKKAIAKVHAYLEEKHSVKIAYSSERDVDDLLTQKQREALQHAAYFGYYDWPREKSITEISEVLKVSKTAFLSHLRKAEQKIIKGFLEEKKLK